MADDSDIPNRKKRDPIMMIGSIVLAAAFIVVISGHAYGQIVPEERGPVNFGDRVQVNYVGSFYGWYDGYDGNGGFDDSLRGVIFDTSLWSVANNDSNAFSWEFDKREERHYTPFNVTVGSGGALALFENALIGMKPGETKRIVITAADGYGELSDGQIVTIPLTDAKASMSVVETMTVSVFRLTFGLDTVATGFYSNLVHPYGWKSNAVVNSDGTVIVTHLVEDREYDAGNGMKSTVVLGNDGTFAVSFDFPNDIIKPYGDGIRLIEFIFGGEKYYIMDISSTHFTMKNTNEIRGMTLYFVITVV
ncbi:MAG: FKBP-type peptidyl-prolyl cis-trans isomerase [Methanomassiliicoccaceae archaeon]|nr:FKBP-type peptidyl-prolyl cis-trans isomerase [Methanomassiliicoccaceae archaeon]